MQGTQQGPDENSQPSPADLALGPWPLLLME